MRSFVARLEAIADFEPLLSAWRCYRSGKRRRPSVARFALNAESLLLELSDEVLAGAYRPAAYDVLPIRDPKPRLIAVAGVGDRVLHRSIYGVLAPSFNRSFIADSYACLPGRGSHRAVLRFLELLRRYNHLMHLDIRAYFPSVDHQILLSLLSPRLRDERVTALLVKILDSGAELYCRPAVAAFYPVAQQDRPHGLPIGNLTSQWWANLYLDGVDHFIKRQLKVPGYLRYMDDLVCFADDAASLRRCRREIAAWLLNERRLHLNVRKGHVTSTQGPHNYLGYRITRQGYDLGRKAMRRFRLQLPKLVARGDRRRLRRALASWRGTMNF